MISSFFGFVSGTVSAVIGFLVFAAGAACVAAAVIALWRIVQAQENMVERLERIAKALEKILRWADGGQGQPVILRVVVATDTSANPSR